MARAGPVRGPARGTMAPGTASPHAVEWSSLLLRWISWVCAGQEALIDVSDLAVTLARRLLETGPIHHCDAAPALPDQPGSLQRAGYHAHGWALHPSISAKDHSNEGA